eukprot:4043331-Amphidinium_carterae.2
MRGRVMPQHAASEKGSGPVCVNLHHGPTTAPHKGLRQCCGFSPAPSVERANCGCSPRKCYPRGEPSEAVTECVR